MTPCFGITQNAFAPNVPNARKLMLAGDSGVRYKMVDLRVLTTTLHPKLEVRDADGLLTVNFLSPTLSLLAGSGCAGSQSA